MPSDGGSPAAAKNALREDLLARRRAMTSGERDAAAEALAQQAAAHPVLARAARVAVYLSMPAEPGTARLIATLAARGARLIAPVSLPDHTLDWAVVEPGGTTAAASIGMREPTGARLGPDAVRSCDLVLLPALAVDHAGHRLGRGAGYYDRALAGVEAPLCAVVFAHELLESVPAEPHDVPVHLALTPQGLFRVP